MANELTTTNAYEQALINGDLSKLTPDQRLSYYKSVCESVGLNPLTKPFEYITLNGKLTLYAKRDATDQLRKINKVSIKITEVKTINDVYVVIAEAKDKDSRDDSSTGAVNIKGLTGDALANAFMKAETKAKRRVTLSICGLGLLDESEIESIKDAKVFAESAPQIEAPKEIPQDLGNYVVKIGKKYKDMKLKDMKDFEIDGYIKYCEDGAAQSNKPLSGDWKEFVEVAKAFRERAPEDTGPEEIPF